MLHLSNLLQTLPNELGGFQVVLVVVLLNQLVQRSNHLLVPKLCVALYVFKSLLWLCFHYLVEETLYGQRQYLDLFGHVPLLSQTYNVVAEVLLGHFIDLVGQLQFG